MSSTTLNRFLRVAVLALPTLALLAICAFASAAQPLLWQRCAKGSAAGQCLIPRGIGVNAETGHLYVADQSNNRIVEFSAWGEFVKAWGWGVEDGSSEPQICTVATTCRAALSGDGNGQLSSPQGVAVDSEGNVYVVDLGNHRVQKFSPGGQFVWMVGTEGAGNGQFGTWPAQSFIAIGPDDQIYVGDQGRIQEFDTSGNFIRVLPDPEGLLAGKLVNALAADPQSGDLYLATAPPDSVFGHEPDPGVFRIDPLTGEKRYELDVEVPTALAVDSDGNVYVFDWDKPGDQGNAISKILKFDPTGELLEEVAHNEPLHVDQFVYSTGIAVGSSCLQSGQDVYVSNSDENSFVKAYGPHPDRYTAKGEKCAPPEVPPTIEDEYALSVESSAAVLGARINPHFWLDTHYYLEYGTGKCSEGGCPDQEPVPPGPVLGSGAVDIGVATDGIHLTGLSLGTTYHYRFVASSSGGGPTIGEERTFTTFNETAPRSRAYEMVSPVDKEGAELEGRQDALFAISTPQGDDLTYSSFWPFADPKAAPFLSQFLAHREAGGWTSHSISPPQEGGNLSNGPGLENFAQIERGFRTFSPDLSSAWLVALMEPLLAPGAQAGFPNIYRADLAGDGYRACTTTEPKAKRLPEFEGSSDDDQHGIFVLRSALTPEANPGTNRQLYECSFGEEGGPATVRLVSRLPNGVAATGESTAGSAFAQTSEAPNVAINEWWLDNAISTDGSRVFWTTHPATGDSSTSLYVRVNASQEQSPFSGGKCSKPGKACTYPLSATEPARFWGATPSGSVALFSVEGGPDSGSLYLFDVDKAIKGEPARTQVAKGNLGVLGASEDLTRIYFLSKEVIDGDGAPGEPNLYLYQAGASPSTTFIATLSKADTGSGNAPTPVSVRPNLHAAHVSPDGAHLAFSASSTALSEATAGYNNVDASTGQPNAEVYRYEVGGQVACVSCNPSGARPAGGRVFEESGRSSYAIAILPTWTSAVYPGRPLSSDGSHLFFESFEPLVSSDTNGAGDVYQWEEASLGGDCESGDTSYVEASGGCVDLISSGKDPDDSRFLDASATGSDVFFTTGESLVPQDPGSFDVYDARVGGGFPSPPVKEACDGESCQPQAPPPPAGADSVTSTFHGTGNRAPRTHCPKGKRKVRKKGKVRCVPRHKHRSHHKQGSHR